MRKYVQSQKKKVSDYHYVEKKVFNRKYHLSDIYKLFLLGAWIQVQRRQYKRLNLGFKVTSWFHICGSMARKKELSNDLKLLIIKLLKNGISQRKVAQTFGCAQSTVCEIW